MASGVRRRNFLRHLNKPPEIVLLIQNLRFPVTQSNVNNFWLDSILFEKNKENTPTEVVA
jgi:hypothetical protein